MVTAQDKPKSRLEATQCPRCKALMKVRKYVPLPGRKFVDVDYRCDGCGAEVLLRLAATVLAASLTPARRFLRP